MGAFSILEKGPHLNPLRWGVVVPIMEPLNTSDVLQFPPLKKESPLHFKRVMGIKRIKNNFKLPQGRALLP